MCDLTEVGTVDPEADRFRRMILHPLPPYAEIHPMGIENAPEPFEGGDGDFPSEVIPPVGRRNRAQTAIASELFNRASEKLDHVRLLL